MEVPRMKFITLNGKINPVISLQKNVFYRLRFINAAIDGVINIYTLQRVGCEWAEIAADGIYFNEIRVKTRCMEPFPSTIVVPVTVLLLYNYLLRDRRVRGKIYY